MKKKIVIAISAIALLTLGAFIGSLTLGSASAQTSTPTTEATPAPQVTITEDDVTPPFGRGVQPGFGGDDTAVAEKLGKTVEEMTAARTAALEKAVDDAVAAGVITQTEADGISTDGIYGWGQLARLAGADYAGTLDQEKYYAEALGVTVEALNQARLEVHGDRLGAAVQAGTMTQEQADAIRAQIGNQFGGRRPLSFGEGLFNKMQNGVPGGMQNGTPGAMQNGIPGVMQNGTPGGMQNGTPGGMKNGVPGAMQNGTPGAMQNGVPGGMFGGGRNGTSNGLGNQGLCDGTCIQTNP